MVTFTGQCLVHRATIKQVHGDWPEALIEAQQACERLAVAADRNATGAAMYRLGELHRCRGDGDAATEAYRQAGEWGYDPQPGLALLWLAAGPHRRRRWRRSRARWTRRPNGPDGASCCPPSSR